LKSAVDEPQELHLETGPLPALGEQQTITRLRRRVGEQRLVIAREILKENRAFVLAGVG
jgi:hypothetical protein